MKGLKPLRVDGDFTSLAGYGWRFTDYQVGLSDGFKAVLNADSVDSTADDK